ncbi:hypothetical protein [Corynebacterium sp. A21]|uniref:hypothetical protein n=1 Tax=Corynebacterium sp. A21 TaxID=3457318 RepID=UPI003FD4DC91
MSFEAVGWALRKAPAKGNAAIILIALAERAGGEYPAFEASFPSHATLAKEAQVSVATVKRVLSDLEKRDVIRRGNQGIPEVLGFRKDRRPVVWNLNEKAVRKDPNEGDEAPTNERQLKMSDRSNSDERQLKYEATVAHSYELQTSLEPPLNLPLERGDSPDGSHTPDSRKKSALPLPQDWMPSQEVIQAMAEECPMVDQSSELLSFRDHWWSKDERRASWDATYRNWIRRAAKWSAPRNGSPQSSSVPAGFKKANASERRMLETLMLLENPDPRIVEAHRTGLVPMNFGSAPQAGVQAQFQPTPQSMIEMEIR